MRERRGEGDGAGRRAGRRSSGWRNERRRPLNNPRKARIAWSPVASVIKLIKLRRMPADPDEPPENSEKKREKEREGVRGRDAHKTGGEGGFLRSAIFRWSDRDYSTPVNEENRSLRYLGRAQTRLRGRCRGATMKMDIASCTVFSAITADDMTPGMSIMADRGSRCSSSGDICPISADKSAHQHAHRVVPQCL